MSGGKLGDKSLGSGTLGEPNADAPGGNWVDARIGWIQSGIKYLINGGAFKK